MRNFASPRRVVAIAFAALAVSLPVASTAADYSAVRQRGWEDMCMRGDQPMNFCSSFAGPKQIAHSPELEATLQNISAEINGRYRFGSDSSTYGVSDYWTVPYGNSADCEDYVLAKIMALDAEGFPVSAMVIMIGQLSNGRWHAVLGVNTDEGMIKLDSLNGLGMGFQTAFYLEMHNTGSWRIANRGR